MWVRGLRVSDFRSLAQAELGLGPGVNLITGPNGAGKTSLLEAIHVVSRGRSFRTRDPEVLVRRGSPGFAVFLETVRGGSAHRLGLGRGAEAWQIRIDEADGQRLSALFEHCAACCFEPGSHELLGGVREERRAFIDWGVFHMEPRFLSHWRRYQRALRQRNAALRAEAGDREIDAWDRELVEAGEWLAAQRDAYLQAFERAWTVTAANWLPELGPARLAVQRGWSASDSLAEALARARPTDRRRLGTSQGPHRFDWAPVYAEAPVVAQLSRGQAKLTALAAVLAQATVYQMQRGQAAVLLLDDLPSELDDAHQARLLDSIAGSSAQVLVTATAASPVMAERLGDASMFHVEQGQVRRVRGG